MKRSSKIIHWILTGIFIASAVFNGIHPSDILIIIAALFVIPITPIIKIRNRIKLKRTVSLILAVVLFLTAILLSEKYNSSNKSHSNTQDSNTAVDIETEESIEKGTTDTSSKEIDEIKNSSEFQNNSNEAESFSSLIFSNIPSYSGKPYITINNNKPSFSQSELTKNAYEKYSPLDRLGRCGFAIASCGKETMPKDGEKRENISDIYPSGWKQAKYDGISDGWLWNRCHLIGWQLSAENANERNLITGTRYMNIEGMLPFENMITDYIKETGNHVAYRVTPVYEGDNLVCNGVQIEAYSIEDDGDGIEFNVFCYNVQPGIYINYKNGESTITETEITTDSTQNETEEEYILNIKTKKIHKKSCSSVNKISKENYAVSHESKKILQSRGYELCGNCFK